MCKPHDDDDPGDGYTYILTKYVTTRNGRRIYAASKGLVAFRIRVKA